MTMQVKYKVHSVVEEKATVEVELQGQQMTAQVNALTVELVDGAGRGHSYRFIPTSPEDMEAHKAMFKLNDSLTATFTKGE